MEDERINILTDRIKILTDRIDELEGFVDERDKAIDKLEAELSEVQDLYENALKTIEVEAFTRAMLVNKYKRLREAALGVRKLAEDISEEPDTLAKDKAYQRLNEELE